MLSNYKTIHMLLTNVHLHWWGGGGGGSSNRNASRDESVEAGDESVETRDESIEAGEKHNNHVIMHCNPFIHVSVATRQQSLMSFLDLSVTQTFGHVPVLVVCQLIRFSDLMFSTLNNMQNIIFLNVDFYDKSSLVTTNHYFNQW